MQQRLRTQLWDVANKLRGNMTAGDFMYFTLGLIFYKYLSQKIELYIDDQLSEDGLTFKQAWTSNKEELKAEIQRICMEDIGYFIEPEFLYSSIIESISHKENILPQLERSLKRLRTAPSATRAAMTSAACSLISTWLPRSSARRLMTKTSLSVTCWWLSTASTSVLRMPRTLTSWVTPTSI